MSPLPHGWQGLYLAPEDGIASGIVHGQHQSPLRNVIYVLLRNLLGTAA